MIAANETLVVIDTFETIAAPGYEPLGRVLGEAHDHAARGKGRQRHQRGTTPFVRQPILEIGRMTGPGGPAFQAIKKTQEALGMIGRGEADRAIAEALGAINYLAAMVILIREAQETHHD